MGMVKEKIERVDSVDFTFGVMTFNQEATVIETLESIKYQVLHYGKELTIALHIIDDCSHDKTVDICSSWISQNNHLFYICKLHKNEVNKGTVSNYIRLLELVNGNSFKVIAGDDLICSSVNIFKSFEDINDLKMKIGTPLFLKEGNIFFTEQRIIDNLYYSHKDKSKQYNMNMIMRGGYFNTPACLITKRLFLNSSAEAFLSKFRLFEDDPTWFSIVKNVDEVDLQFVKDVFVIYRLSSSSVSHIADKKSPFYDELRLLHKEYMPYANILTRLILKCQDSNLPRFLRMDLYIKKIFYTYKRLIVIIRYHSEYKQLKKKIAEIQRIEKDRYGQIKSITNPEE